MDPISTVSNTSPPTAAEAAPRKTALTSDFDTFLRMLTVQAQNQDPLNPIDATDYATQLATFSNVEQQVVANDLLTQIAAAVGGSPLEGLRAWVGADVLAEGSAYFDGNPVTVRPDVATEATAARLVVADADGTVVSRRAIDPTSDSLEWDGRTAQGAALPHGAYTLSVESIAEETVIATRPAAVFNRVSEARFDAKGETVLVLRGGAELRESDALGMRVGQ